MTPPAPSLALSARRLLPILAGLAGLALLQCSSNSSGGTECYPDNDGQTGGGNTFVLTVDDTGFSKNLLNTQNDARVTLTLTNMGTTPHGFAVGCVSVASAYPNLPKGCATTACFPSDAAIAPLAPGASATITFVTPVPDNLIYPFTSNEPNDASVAGLNNGQWSLM